MKIFVNKSFSLIPLLIAMLPLTARAEQKVPVSIHGVNYSNEDFSFALIDPEDSKNGGSGEIVGRFSGGGTVCCYSLPKIWHPGIKVVIKSQHWLKRDSDGKLPEIDETHTIDVPRYADDKVSDLWVLRQQDGSYAVISSRYQPDHEKWPGPIKGWPIPSLEYRQEHVALALKEAESRVKRLEEAEKELDSDPLSHARRMWPLLLRAKLINLSAYTGPEDERFQNYLKESNKELLLSNRERVNNLKNYKP